MALKYHSFVILGAMRTGSNFLESSLAELDAITCYGEVFNPFFIGKKGQKSLFGINLRNRELRPELLYSKLLEETDGIAGIRYFQGHHSGILKTLLNDPNCAKIILTRNPLDSFVSLEIAMKTQEWVIESHAKPTSTMIKFRPYAFKKFLHELDGFYTNIRRSLQVLGQSAFEISYEDLNDAEVLNGLIKWLGINDQLKSPSARFRRQNPTDLSEKVENIDTVQETLRDLDPFQTRQSYKQDQRSFLPLKTMIAAQKAPLLYLPMQSGPTDVVKKWLSLVDGIPEASLKQGLSAGAYNEWISNNPGHRSFTVIRHPLERAHEALCTHLLMPGPQRFGAIRSQLQNYYIMDFPGNALGPEYDLIRHRQLLLDFLGFIRRNVRGLTSIRTDPAWAPQDSLLKAMSTVRAPDMIIREDQLSDGLSALCASIGRTSPALPNPDAVERPFDLADIYDEEIETAARLAYDRDYPAFGFSDWKPLKPL